MLAEHPELTDEIASLLSAWPAVPYTVMAEVLKHKNISLADGQLSRHHRSVCRCRP